MNIAVVGTGYVGLVSGTCFAESGNEVICVDIDRSRIEMLNAGQIPIYEPGLEELVRRNVKEARLCFTTDVERAVAQSMVSFIAVGTPMSKTGAADLSGVLSAAESIARVAIGYHIIAIKSTVPVGTSDRVRKAVEPIANHRGGLGVEHRLRRLRLANVPAKVKRALSVVVIIALTANWIYLLANR